MGYGGHQQPVQAAPWTARAEAGKSGLCTVQVSMFVVLVYTCQAGCCSCRLFRPDVGQAAAGLYPADCVDASGLNERVLQQ